MTLSPAPVPALLLAMVLAVIGPAALVRAPAAAAEASTDVTLRAGSKAVDLVTGSTTSSPGPSVTLGRIGVYEPGTYEITGDVVARHMSTDPVDLVSVSIGCRDKTGREQRTGAYMNTLAVAPTTSLRPRLVMHARDDFSCWLVARAMRITTGSTGTAPQVVHVPTAELTVTRVHHRARASQVHDDYDDTRMLGASRLVLSGRTAVPTSARTVLARTDRATTLKVSAQLQLTSCSHKAGSGDVTTGGRQLCLEPGAYVNLAAGPVVYTQLFVRQMTPTGAVCRTVEVPEARTYSRLSAARHHAPRNSTGEVTLQPRSGCGGEVRAFVRVSVSGGPGLVVHWPGSSVDVVPVA